MPIFVVNKMFFHTRNRIRYILEAWWYNRKSFEVPESFPKDLIDKLMAISKEDVNERVYLINNRLSFAYRALLEAEGFIFNGGSGWYHLTLEGDILLSNLSRMNHYE